MALPNRMSLRPGLLWLTLNLALFILRFSRSSTSFFSFIYPVMYLRVLPEARVPQVETTDIENSSFSYSEITIRSVETFRVLVKMREY
jgi:hypothetical protein